MKAGDRVRINCPGSLSHGEQATILSIDETGMARIGHDPDSVGKAAYFVCVDGIGAYQEDGITKIAFERHELTPITKPKEEAGTWEATFKGTDFDIRRENVSSV